MSSSGILSRNDFLRVEVYLLLQILEQNVGSLVPLFFLGNPFLHLRQ